MQAYRLYNSLTFLKLFCRSLKCVLAEQSSVSLQRLNILKAKVYIFTRYIVSVAVFVEYISLYFIF